jgi:multiple sugar transport system ATP-binding protein
MSEVRFEQATKLYAGNDQAAVDALELQIRDGELMVLVGPSGSGKSTALRMLAGLEEVDAGAVWIGEDDVTDVAPKDRDVAMVFQNYALYPYLDVAANLAFPLKMARVKGAERDRRVRETAELLDLTPYLQRKPAQLSGGQRQRVAMGRAIIREPAVFLMDEPLSNLDAKLRVQMRTNVAQIQNRLGTTTVYVTHDQVEAMTLGDRVAIMRDGVLQQVAKPQELYDRPRNLFVAEFIGSPAMNLVGVDLALSNGNVVAKFGDNTLEVDERVLLKRPGLVAFEGKRIILGVRPEDLEDAAFSGEAPAGRRLSAPVDIREDMGSEVYLHFGVAGKAVRGEDVRAAVGEEAAEVAEVKGNVWVARVDRDTKVQEEGRVELVVDTTRLHFFDPETGGAIY